MSDDTNFIVMDLLLNRKTGTFAMEGGHDIDQGLDF